MAKKRVDFTKKYRNWTAENWFSDESTLQCFRGTLEWVHHPSSAASVKITIRIVKIPDQVMVWSCFSGNGWKGDLCFLEKNASMSSECCLKISKDHLLPFLTIHQTKIFNAWLHALQHFKKDQRVPYLSSLYSHKKFIGGSTLWKTPQQSIRGTITKSPDSKLFNLANLFFAQLVLLYWACIVSVGEVSQDQAFPSSHP